MSMSFRLLCGRGDSLQNMRKVSSMNNPTIVYAFLFVTSLHTEARIFQTSDTIITEAEDFSGGLKGQSIHNDGDPTMSWIPSESLPISKPVVDELIEPVRDLPSETFSLTHRTCWTPDGRLGTCNSIRSCNPNIKLPTLNYVDLGKLGTCVSAKSEGIQVYGVCCPVRQAPPFTGFPFFPPGSPWWSIFIPFGPLATAGASTTTSRPSTTTKPTVAPSTAPVVIDSSVGGINASCGVGPFKTLSADEQKRIVGGTNAIRNSWPFVAALFSGDKHLCGGSLIDSSHILTAAHCIAEMSSADVSRLEVALAMHTLKPYDSQALRKRVRRVARHKGFDPNTVHNDIAILTLDSPVTFSSTISPVCLPPIDTTDQFINKESTVLGWGLLEDGGHQSDVLQQVTVQMKSNAECNENYENEKPARIVDHMICAAYPGKDSCTRDSGGPMVTQASPGSPWIQVGVVSWGIGCAEVPFPGVYSRITSFLPWIHRNSQ